MNKNQWIAKAEAELIRRLGPPVDSVEAGNLRAWAESLADDSYFSEGYSPEDAVYEDLSYAF